MIQWVLWDSWGFTSYPTRSGLDTVHSAGGKGGPAEKNCPSLEVSGEGEANSNIFFSCPCRYAKEQQLNFPEGFGPPTQRWIYNRDGKKNRDDVISRFGVRFLQTSCLTLSFPLRPIKVRLSGKLLVSSGRHRLVTSVFSCQLPSW